MNNAKPPIVSVPVSLFAGLYTEANPADLPEGASPLTVNCDYILGEVHQRPSEQNVYSFSDFFIQKSASVGQSIPGANAPNEAAWTNPNNLSLNSPPNYATARLNTTIVPGPASMIQRESSQTDSVIPQNASVIPASFPTNGFYTPGNSFIVGLTQHNANGNTTASVSSVTDLSGNIYSLVARSTPTLNAPGAEIWRADNVLPEASGVLTSVLVSGGTTTYFGTIPNGAGNLNTNNGGIVGSSVRITGFGNAGNNLLNVGVTSSTATSFTVNTTTQVNETHAGLVTEFNVIFGHYAIAGGGNITANIEAREISPLLATDQTAVVSNQGPATALSAGTVITNNANEFCFAVFSSTGNPVFTSGAGWTSNNAGTGVWFEFQIPSSPGSLTGNATLNVANTYSAVMATFPGTGTAIANVPFSQKLVASNFQFSIPSTQNVLGFTLEVDGKQSAIDASSFLTATLISPASVPRAFTFQLGLSDGSAIVGTPTETWNFFSALVAAMLNNPSFGIDIVAQSTNQVGVVFNVSGVKIKAYLTPNPAPSINYLKTFSETGGEVLTLALGSDGVMYQEDALNNPGVLKGVYTAIEPNSFAESCTQSDREFIAISNLLNGTDIPYSYNGTNFDRLSQVGPGAPPTASTSSSGSAILTITQPVAFAIPSNPNGWLIWSDAPTDFGTFGTPSTPGNVLSFVMRQGTVLPSWIVPGANLVLAGLQSMSGFNANNGVGGNPAFYTVSIVGGNPTPGGFFVAFTVTLARTGFYNAVTQAGATVQSTLATMTAAVQVPNLEVGNQFQVSGDSVPGYNNTWKVTATPNASQLQITSTQLSANVATYSFNLVSGTAPVVGQFVSVTQTLNGNGVFNVQQAVITAVTPNSFSLALTGPDIANAAEAASGIIFGTIFNFDAFAFFGNGVGGQVVTVGIIGQGQRKICYSFLTRSGYVTAPSPIFTFDVVAGASAIDISNLLTGPSNTIARIIHLTSADGGNFYNIPVPVTVTDPTGAQVVNTSTFVNDNTSTSARLSFSDGVLLGGEAIDVQGNNLFETAELGSVLALIPYGARVFALGEQNKLTNLLNWSFDGGVQITLGNVAAGGGAGANSTSPAGWTVDLTNGGGVSVVASPIFGNALSIQNLTGSTQATYGMITQPAFQDEFLVPIIRASTTYSVRATLSVPSGATTGQFVVDLFDPAHSAIVGSFSVDLSTAQSTMLIFNGKMLTTLLSPVPKGLLLRVYATNILNGAQILVDRVEVFPTEEPNLATQLTGSYVNNFEAFDQIDGVIDGSVQNQQPIRSAFELYDTLYMVKTGSLISTQDNGTTEPQGWKTRTVSPVVGTPSIYGVDSGEEWAVIAGQAGLFIFNGGEPIKLTEEIQSLWNQINWNFGHTLWVKNDIVNRRILVGVPLKTPNKWLPTGIIPDNQNPTTPNVVLDLNYKQLNTASALADSPGVHRSYAGKLIASEIVRKWSIWTMSPPCAAFITRADTTTPIFLGNSQATGKVYTLIDDLLADDGAAVTQIYDTYGFVNAEQEQGLQLGSVRKIYEYMTALLAGTGDLQITVFPNTLDTPYADQLLPNIALPGSIDGDTEIPVNETANRLFVQFKTNAAGAGFKLSRLTMMMRQDPWSPVRGANS